LSSGAIAISSMTLIFMFRGLSLFHVMSQQTETSFSAI